jgi:predicted lysophospholipase L1 biosynthesis ABC-type transport system permease subunit
MQAMKRGEESALYPRDRGPARRLARNYVDAHRRPMEFYMYALIVLVIGLFAGKSNAISHFTEPLLIAVIVVLVVDGYLLRRSITKLVHERLPNEPTRGLAMYSIMRALQLRRFRTPPPQVKPGDDF